MIFIFVFLVNRSKENVLYSYDSCNYNLLKAGERISFNCSSDKNTCILIRSEQGSIAVQRREKYAILRALTYLDRKRNYNYHLSIESEYEISGINEFDDLEIFSMEKELEDHCYYNYFHIHCKSRCSITVKRCHIIDDKKMIDFYKKNTRIIGFRWFFMGLLIDACFCSFGFFLLASIINILDDPRELVFWSVLVSVIFLLIFIPNFIALIKGLREKPIVRYCTENLENFLHN